MYDTVHRASTLLPAAARRRSTTDSAHVPLLAEVLNKALELAQQDSLFVRISDLIVRLPLLCSCSFQSCS